MILIKDTYGSTLVGAIDGVNKVFTVRAAFLPDSVNVYLNGLLKVRNWDDGFTVTEPRTVTLKEAPLVGDSLEIEYQALAKSGGGALGGIPASPTIQDLRPRILDAVVGHECVDEDSDVIPDVDTALVYWGVGPSATYDAAFITALTSATASSRARALSLAPAGERMFYAIPASFGTPTFTIDGFSGGFSLAATVNVVAGLARNYDLWVADNDVTGTFQVVVT